jgi:hypothetical protein
MSKAAEGLYAIERSLTHLPALRIAIEILDLPPDEGWPVDLIKHEAIVHASRAG